jgi:anti-anti-sigma regulatory factor
MLRITRRQVDDVMVLGLRGTIAPGAPVDILRDAVRQALAQGIRTLVLDLTRATSTNPSGVSALLTAKLDGLAAGAEVVVTNVTKGMDMVVAAALFRYFEVFDTPESALERLILRERHPDDDTGPLGARLRAA